MSLTSCWGSVSNCCLRQFFSYIQCLKWTANATNILFGRPKAAPNWLVTGPTKIVVLPKPDINCNFNGR